MTSKSLSGEHLNVDKGGGYIMHALRRPVAILSPRGGAYGGLRNGKRKIEKQRPGGIFLIFFRFQRDLSQHLGIVMSNIQGLPIRTRNQNFSQIGSLSCDTEHDELTSTTSISLAGVYQQVGYSPPLVSVSLSTIAIYCFFPIP